MMRQATIEARGNDWKLVNGDGVVIGGVKNAALFTDYEYAVSAARDVASRAGYTLQLETKRDMIGVEQKSQEIEDD